MFHRVIAGESLTSIAADYRWSVDALLAVNASILHRSFIRTAQILEVAQATP